MTRRTLRAWMAEGPFSLAMSSGFFGFFAHCGLVRALEEEGVQPAAIAGSSAGALVGGMWAAGMSAAAMTDELRRLDRAAFWDPGPGAGLLRGKKFQAHLERLLPARTFDACRVPLSVSVFDWLSRRTAVLDRGALAPALRASCAVPVLFHPVLHGGRLYADGGILDRPGLEGLPPGGRVLFHHLASRSPWRHVDPSLRIPQRDGMLVLILEGLPRSGPFKLDEGRRAMTLAYEAARRALDHEVSGARLVVNAHG